jgi:hypothetical protein
MLVVAVVEVIVIVVGLGVLVEVEGVQVGMLLDFLEQTALVVEVVQEGLIIVVLFYQKMVVLEEME